jgi:hypothetical protein
MKTHHLFACALVALCSVVQAQQTIYRCGNEYTNDGFDAKARGCRTISGGNITVVPSVAPAVPTAPGSSASTPSAPKSTTSSIQRVDSSEQRARDADAKAILESELRKAEQRREQLKQEFNNGQPEKSSSEVKNYQKYLERVTQMRDQMTRIDNDIGALRRELGRAGGKPTL